LSLSQCSLTTTTIIINSTDNCMTRGRKWLSVVRPSSETRISVRQQQSQVSVQ